jgi:hypothetical protein
MKSSNVSKKKQSNTYQLTHAKTMQWTGIFITASNYDEAAVEARRLQDLHGVGYGIIRMKK